MTEKKTTISQEPRLGKKIKVETEKMDKLLANIPKDNSSELNELIYAGAKLINDSIDVPLRKPNMNIKPGCEISQEGQVKKLQQ